VLFAPFVPLLFMGEEYAEAAPFQYFTSHSGAALIEAVRRGRAQEFEAFRWSGEPPDPQSEETFRRCILNWDERTSGAHAQMLALYRELLGLRRELAPLRMLDPRGVEVARSDAPPVVWLLRIAPGGEAALLCLHVGREPARLDVPFGTDGGWRPLLDSADARFGGPGAGRLDEALAVQPTSFVLLAGDARG
jgi:maltooligosyltrehalose trehalohydrolase